LRINYKTFSIKDIFLYIICLMNKKFILHPMIKNGFRVLLFLFLIVMAPFNLSAQNAQLHLIPDQTIDAYKLLGDSSNSYIETIVGFEISDLVSYKDYKQYLNAIKKDSSDLFYLSQLPDTNIGSKAIYDQYITGNVYDNFPVLGISWENAMNYCKWKTITENSKDSIVFIYRLPDCSEWLAVYTYYQKNNISNDFNKTYSDWLLNAKDESLYKFSDDNIYPFDYIYFQKKNDPPVLKRKFVIGDSFLYQQDKLINYYRFGFYSTQGYRQVAFRYVKEFIKTSKKPKLFNHTLAESLLEYWGLKVKK